MIDTHLHIDRLENPGEALREARERGVETFVVPGVRPSDWPALMACVSQHAGALAAPGVHPLAADEWHAGHAAALRQLARDRQVVAIGEVGLDRKVAAPWQTQEEVLRQMIRLARELDRPLLIHYRGATDRLLQILGEENATQVGGIVHAYSGSSETASQFIDLGFALGIGGIITYPEGRRLPAVVRTAPAEALVLETDAPYIPPHPRRDRPNHPANLALVARAVAELRDWSLEETARITTQNARRVLRIG